MTQTPPVPAASQSPFPIQEPPHPHVETADAPGTPATDPVAAARDAVAPLADKARAFAKARPFATAALVGTIGLALLNTLRGMRRN